MNYIKHLNTIFHHFVEDTRLRCTHISLYMALFQLWNLNRFRSPISINRSEVMYLSKIGSMNTYHKCLNDLHHYQYLDYQPSRNPMVGSLVHMYKFDTSTATSSEQVPAQVPSQVVEPSLNRYKQEKQNKQIEKEDVFKFFKSNNSNTTVAQQFYDHYQKNNWCIKKEPIQDWQRVAQKWINTQMADNTLSATKSKNYSEPL